MLSTHWLISMPLALLCSKVKFTIWFEKSVGDFWFIPQNGTESKIKTQSQMFGFSLIRGMQCEPIAPSLQSIAWFKQRLCVIVCMCTMCTTYVKVFSKQLPREPTISPSVQTAWPRKSCMPNKIHKEKWQSKWVKRRFFFYMKYTILHMPTLILNSIN